MKKKTDLFFQCGDGSELERLIDGLTLTFGESDKITPAIKIPKKQKSPRKETKQILALMAQGLEDDEIAQKLLLSLRTVAFYKKELYRALKINSKQRALYPLRAVLCYFYRANTWEECKEKIKEMRKKC